MHDIRAIRDNPDLLTRALTRRGMEGAKALVDALLDTDKARRAAISEAETLLARRNSASKEIGQAMAAKDAARAETLKAEVNKIKGLIADAESQKQALESELQDALAALPNLPLDEVPDGADEHGNVEYTAPSRTDVPGSALARPAIRLAEGADHVALGEALGQMDFEVAAKLSGSRFVVLKGGIARLERALGQFMLDLHTNEHGYTEVNPPILVNGDALFGTAQLPKFDEDQFPTRREYGIGDAWNEWEKSLSDELRVRFLSRDAEGRIWATDEQQAHFQKFFRKWQSLWLIPTAEVPLTNLVREKILSEEELPLRFTALTPCFRAEAGSAGRDTRGMLRQHQFNKVELVSITTPETSADEHERMLACAETVLKTLGLAYRVMTLCTGDMGFASRKTYDIEVWLPGQKTYREISSCSVCGDFQARRMDARYRPSGDKNTRFVHTLNGSGVAVGRCLIAVMENYQNPDGSIEVPDALRPYLGGSTRIVTP